MRPSREEILECIRAAVAGRPAASPAAADHPPRYGVPADPEAGGATVPAGRSVSQPRAPLQSDEAATRRGAAVDPRHGEAGRVRIAHHPSEGSEPAESDATPADATERFLREARAAGAQISMACDVAHCAQAIEDYLAQMGAVEVVVHDEPLARAVAARVTKIPCRLASDETEHPPGGVVCSLLGAAAALADTGSVIVVTRCAADRRLPYAASACVVVLPVQRIAPTLAAPVLAWLADQAREPSGGEAAIITGPSRTADIEKMLVIGAHGPRRVAIVVVEQPPEPGCGGGR